MGGGEIINAGDYEDARRLGGLIAREGWILLNGGRASGIMEASARGAKENGGLTIGILPGNNPAWASEYIDIPILTGIGFARNYINVLTSIYAKQPEEVISLIKKILRSNFDKGVGKDV
jgi:uncharacterized protein (TIGR00725 family)